MIIRSLLILFLTAFPAWATDYSVGPGQTYTNIVDVPWHTITAGDTVYVHYRETPYYEKILLSGKGTSGSPVRLIGVVDGSGNRPIIDGTNAVSGSNYWDPSGDTSGATGAEQNIINVHTRATNLASVHTTMGGGNFGQSSYIEIRNFEIRNSTGSYTNSFGLTATYTNDAACIGIHMTDNIIIDNNIIHNCGNGIFGAPLYYGTTSNLTVSNNHFYDNGRSGGYLEHQIYAEFDKITIEGNRIGPNISGAYGSQIKDRSAGTVIRYNDISASRSGRQLDLVETENSVENQAFQNLPYYLETFVYGNKFRIEHTDQAYFIHYGGDNSLTNSRTYLGGTLYFYNNTVVILRPYASWRVHLVDTMIGGGSESSCNGVCMIDFRNNIFASVAPTGGSGTADVCLSRDVSERWIFGNNWISPGWYWTNGSSTPPSSVIGIANMETAGSINLTDPQIFAMELLSGSAAIDNSGGLAPAVTSNTLGLDLTPVKEFVSFGVTQNRADIDDLGAYAYTGGPSPTCNDSIQNGDESGVDCGGSCPVSCSGQGQFGLSPSGGTFSLNAGGSMTLQ